jgi:hypothetical protein
MASGVGRVDTTSADGPDDDGLALRCAAGPAELEVVAPDPECIVDRATAAGAELIGATSDLCEDDR